jgi:nifR3 family TIM-barrel protein
MAEAVERLDAIEREGQAIRHGEDGSLSSVVSCVSYDVNMGCPVAKVVKNGEGSALMRDPDKAARIVESMARATGKPVTVKMRAGWDAADAASGVAVSFARAMEEAGAAAVAVHGRTREQYYSGKADWGVIARVKDALSVPVIGSGDVMAAEDAVRMLRETGCDLVMIARGALGNPWIFAEASALWGGSGRGYNREHNRECVSMFIRHARMLEGDKGEYIAVREMRKHAGWYFKGRRGVAALRARVNAAESISELIGLVSPDSEQA